MTARCVVIVVVAVVAVLAVRPAYGQRLADLPPVFIAHPYVAPVNYGECPVLTRAGWALGGAIVGVMAGMAVLAMTVWDGGPSTHHGEVAIALGGGALVGGAYGWFVLAARYSCG